MRTKYKFRDVSELFKMIEDEKINVIVARETESLNLVTKIEQDSSSLSKQEWRKLYQYSVSIRQNLFEKYIQKMSNFLSIFFWVIMIIISGLQFKRNQYYFVPR